MSQTIKVGIFVSLALATLAVLILKVEDLRLFGSKGQRVDVLFDSVVGLDDKAPVRVAGVRVGRVDGIALAGRRARVTLLLDQEVPLPAGSTASIASAGILGDKYVELLPGPSSAPARDPNQPLEGTVPVSFDQALAQLSELGGSLQELAGGLAKQDLGPSLGRLLDNLEATTAEIRALVAANREEVTGTVRNFERFSATLAAELPQLTAQMKKVLEQVDGVVADNRTDLKASLENIRLLTEKIQTSADNLNTISTKIASGEGTLGKLISSDEAHQSLVSTLGTVEKGVGTLTDTLGRIGKLELELGLESGYFTGLDESRSEVSFHLVPGQSNRFYQLALVDDSRGRLRRRTDVLTTTGPDGTVSTTTVEQLTNEDDFTISAQFGFSFGEADFRAGLFESRGGAAFDYHFFEKRMRLSLEAFDFSRQEDPDPRLRFLAEWRVRPNFYIVGGYDDFLSENNDSLFVGAGLRWKDDDLKYLLGSIPSF